VLVVKIVVIGFGIHAGAYVRGNSEKVKVDFPLLSLNECCLTLVSVVLTFPFRLFISGAPKKFRKLFGMINGGDALV
jgi:hypothetical protein